jgi:hypothetical protein
MDTSLIDKEDINTIEQVSNNEQSNDPLQTPSIVVQGEQLDDRTLLDDQGRPNVSRSPSTSTPVELDSDTSHAKVIDRYVVFFFEYILI